MSKALKQNDLHKCKGCSAVAESKSRKSNEIQMHLKSFGGLADKHIFSV
jgi:hypothetical protein